MILPGPDKPHCRQPTRPDRPAPATVTGDRSAIDRLVAILRTGRHGADVSNDAANMIEKLADAEFEAVCFANSLSTRDITSPQDEAAPLTVGVRADDLAELLKSATEAAEDLAAEIDRKHGLPDPQANPVTARAHARDMQPVIRLRAALNILAKWREGGA